jgi:hypothetical protein
VNSLSALDHQDRPNRSMINAGNSRNLNDKQAELTSEKADIDCEDKQDDWWARQQSDKLRRFNKWVAHVVFRISLPADFSLPTLRWVGLGAGWLRGE